MDAAHQDEQWMPLADVVAATGLRADLLRAWERRYGFPVPARDDRGRRCFAPEQLDRLRLLRRLIDAGARAGAVVPCPCRNWPRWPSNRAWATPAWQSAWMPMCRQR
jgi:hypothetical protein